MRNILFIKSSLNAEQGNSNQLASELLAQLIAKTPATVIERDLNKEQLPHLSQQEMAAWMTLVDERNEEQKKLVDISDQLITELQHCDTVVVAMPMYNLGVPSIFKAWIDRVARAGITFKYTEQGPVGLLQNKKVIVVAARGGVYAGTAKDTQTQYLKDVFAFIGLSDVEFIYAEGLNMPIKAERIEMAKTDINQLVEKLVVNG